MKIDIFQIWIEAFKIASPALMLLFLFICVKKFLVLREKRELAKSGIDQIDVMDGKTFEKYLEVLFEKLGYRVERTRYVGDYGADLVTRKDGAKTVIQCKRHKGKVGVKAIQEAVAAKGYYGCERSMVVTNSFFTHEARRLASSNDVTLWDRKDLARAMTSVNVNAAPNVSTPAIKPTVTEINISNSGTNGSVCATCGRAVSEKVRDYCRNNEKRFGGRIYCFEHQRRREVSRS